MKQSIQIIGTGELDDIEVDASKRLAKYYYEKIQHRLLKLTTLVMHIKSHKNKKIRGKYTISIEAISPDTSLSVQTIDWSIDCALHKGFKTICEKLSGSPSQHQSMYMHTVL